MKSCVTFFAILVGLATLQPKNASAAPVCGNDNFDDNMKGTNLWGTDRFDLQGQLVEANGRLEFRGTGACFRPYVRSYRSFTRNWEVITDVSVGNVPLTQPHSGGQMLLSVANGNEPILMGGFIPRDYFAIALDIWRNPVGGVERSIESYLSTDLTKTRRGKIFTSSQRVGLRITFDAATKILSAWYDIDGISGGYTWTTLDSIQVDANGSNWEMATDSTFQVFLGAGTDGIVVTSSDLVYADNFSICDDLESPALLISRSGAVPQVTISGSAGAHAEIQFAETLSSTTSWLPLANFVFTGNSETITDASAAGIPSRFYRARLIP